MRQFIILAAIVGLCSCGRLDSKYLPPNQAGFNQYSNQDNFNQASYVKSPSQEYNGPINKAANDVPILKLDNNNDGETYNYALETGDGVSVQEQGDARGDGTNAQGGFSYTAPDGQQIQVQYVAGPDGFVAQGAHLPTAPPVPEDIQKAVQQNLAEEANGVFDDGQYREEAGNSGKYEGDNSGNFAGYSGGFQKQVKKQFIAPTNQGQGGYKY